MIELGIAILFGFLGGTISTLLLSVMYYWYTETRGASILEFPRIVHVGKVYRKTDQELWETEQKKNENGKTI